MNKRTRAIDEDTYKLIIATMKKGFAHEGVQYKPNERIANNVTADTEHSACILSGNDMKTGGTLIQYQETDWKFLKRMASQLGLPLVPDTGYYYPRFYIGLPEGEKQELGEILSCDICFDGRYYAVSGNSVER